MWNGLSKFSIHACIFVIFYKVPGKNYRAIFKVVFKCRRLCFLWINISVLYRKKILNSERTKKEYSFSYNKLKKCFLAHRAHSIAFPFYLPRQSNNSWKGANPRKMSQVCLILNSRQTFNCDPWSLAKNVILYKWETQKWQLSKYSTYLKEWFITLAPTD